MNSLQATPGTGIFRRVPGLSMAVINLALSATIVFSGCASAPEKSPPMIDPQADFGQYRTFGWYADPSAHGSSQPASVMDGSIRAAIATEMQRKGYVEAPAGTEADLRIEYEVERAEKVKSNPVRIGVGVGGYGSNVGGGVSVGSPSGRKVSEGSLVIHVIDPVRKAEVWRSRVSRDLGKGNIKPEAVQGAVADVLSDFPPRTAKL